jgi:hypothetical protein
MMLAGSLLVLQFAFQQFFEDPRSYAGIDKIERICSDYWWPCSGESFVVPSTQSKHLLVKFIWKSLRPLAEFFSEKLV